MKNKIGKLIKFNGSFGIINGVKIYKNDIGLATNTSKNYSNYTVVFIKNCYIELYNNWFVFL